MKENLDPYSRLYWIDFARGIAILLVVYRHVFDGLKRWADGVSMDISNYIYLEHLNIYFFSFRMPLFFMISGFFLERSLQKRGVKEFVKNKFNTILYPYFLWGAIQITLQIIASGYINSDKSVGDFLYLFYSPRAVEQFWYLAALFNLALLYVVLSVFLKVKAHWQVVIGLALFLLSNYFYQQQIDLHMLADVLHYFLFVAIGVFISHSVRKGALRRFFMRPLSFLLLIIPFAIGQYFFLQINLNHINIAPKYNYVETAMPFLFLIISLTGCAFVISLSSMLEKFSAMNWLKVVGRYSLQIYVMHVIAFSSVRTLLIHVFHITNFPLLLVICIAAGIVLPMLFAWLVEKLNINYVFELGKKQNKNSVISMPSAKMQLHGQE